MRKLVGLVLVVGFASTSAFAGTVGFVNPSSPDAGDASILSLAPGDSGFFDVFVQDTTNNPGNSLDIIFLADLDGPESDPGSRGLAFPGFSFSSAFLGATQVQNTSTPDQVDGASEFKVGGVNFGGNVIGFPLEIGTLEVLASADLAPGDYFVTVSNDRDGVSKVSAVGGTPDPLFGSGTVRVTPEPATLALLGIGGLAVLRRRRTS